MLPVIRRRTRYRSWSQAFFSRSSVTGRTSTAGEESGGCVPGKSFGRVRGAAPVKAADLKPSFAHYRFFIGDKVQYYIRKVSGIFDHHLPFFFVQSYAAPVGERGGADVLWPGDGVGRQQFHGDGGTVAEVGIYLCSTIGFSVFLVFSHAGRLCERPAGVCPGPCPPEMRSAARSGYTRPSSCTWAPPPGPSTKNVP